MEWYQTLLEEIQALLTEKSFEERWTRIEKYHKLGETLKQYSQYAPISNIVREVSRDTGVAERNLWYAVKFFETYPDLSQVPEGKAASWAKIKQSLSDGEPRATTPQEVASRLLKRYGTEFALEVAKAIHAAAEPV